MKLKDNPKSVSDRAMFAISNLSTALAGVQTFLAMAEDAKVQPALVKCLKDVESRLDAALRALAGEEPANGRDDERT